MDREKTTTHWFVVREATNQFARTWIDITATATMLILLALAVTVASPVAAQNPSSPHWSIVVEPQGYTTYTHTFHSGGTGTYPFEELGQWDDDSGYLPIWVSNQDTVALSASGKYVIKCTWVDTTGTVPAPPILIIKVSASADWSAPFSASVSNTAASNGLGSSYVTYSGSGSQYGQSSGTKLIQMDGTSGYVEYEVTQSSSVTATGTTVTNGEGFVWVGHGVSATAIPVYITRNGSRLIAPNNKILIGEQNIYAVSAGTLQQSGHNWTVAGNLFYNYYYSHPPSD